ncbi:MAG TPA: dienelactone hydrolase family protein [Alphaproteobacteria bacterium]|jgi:carboxymethylenebutenolidase|nr:dienelactone hydrolase family protein [Alphaproteobacteria bacterium]
MGATVRLTAADGHEFAAYRAAPSGPRRGGIVVLQEIFGVNAHIRAEADKFATEGYEAVAPALFDRVERDVELGYTQEATAKGRALRTSLGFDAPMRDISAAMAALRPAGKVGVVGYCWGASLAWLAACRLDADCAICYYGAQIREFAGESPRCPVALHFGEKDPLIPPEAVAAIRGAHPGIPVFTYPAGHGFNCDMRADYDAESAALAFARTRAFLRKYVG